MKKKFVSILLICVLACPINLLMAQDGSEIDERTLDELFGLPVNHSIDTISGAYLKVLLQNAGVELLDMLERIEDGDRVTILSSFSRENSVKISGSKVFLPNPDGVVDDSDITDADYTSYDIYDASLTSRFAGSFDDHKIVVVVGWKVELVQDIFTQGRTLMLITDHLRTNDKTINTEDTRSYEDKPAEEPDGRQGLHAGDVGIFANLLSGAPKIVANGARGEYGDRGRRPEFSPESLERIARCEDRECDERIECDDLARNGETTRSGDGGDGGDGGNVYLLVTAINRDKEEIDIPTDEACYENNCASPGCTDAFMSMCGEHNYDYTMNPEQIVFEPLEPTGIEETDDASCSDGADNDYDGEIDCEDRECQINPRVTVCNTEHSLEACVDGIDNDEDGHTDCQDPDCRYNPYVMLCAQQYYPFLQESSTDTCTDGVDNDPESDRAGWRREFIDCGDYGCQNNPFVTQCRCPDAPNNNPASVPALKDVCAAGDEGRIQSINFENSVEECTDGTDNDGDGKVDCRDPHCRWNPFFGEPVCRGRIRTEHPDFCSQGLNSKQWYCLRDILPASQFELQGGSQGRGGMNNHLEFRQLEEAGVCTDGNSGSLSDFICSEPRHRYVRCIEVPAGNHGEDGNDGQFHIQQVEVHQVDAIRTLLSPYHWTTINLYGNHYFKKGDDEKAKFFYFFNFIHLNSIAVANEDCDCDDLYEREEITLLEALVCPNLFESTAKLDFILNGLNFYGKTPNIIINPFKKVRGEGGLIERFNSYIDIIDERVSFIRSLQTEDRIDEVLQNQERFLETQIVDSHFEFAENELYIAALEEKIGNLKDIETTLENQFTDNNERMEYLNDRIRDKYNPPPKTMGEILKQFIFSALKAVGKYYLGQFADILFPDDTAAGGDSPTLKAFIDFNASDGKVRINIATFTKTSDGETTREERPLSKAWNHLKDLGKAVGKDKDVKKAAIKAATDAAKNIFKTHDVPSRSVVVDEIENVVVDSRQKHILIDVMDIEMELAMAEAEKMIAFLRQNQVKSKIVNLAAQARNIRGYREFCTTDEGDVDACLTEYQRSFLYKENIKYLVELVDELPYDYLEILRYAEWELQPFTVDDGTNNLFGEGTHQINNPEDLNINLRNYFRLQENISNLNTLYTMIESGKTSDNMTFYYRWVGMERFIPAASHDKEFLQMVGAINSDIEVSMLKLNITNDLMFSTNPLLRNIALHQIKDVKMRIITRSGEGRYRYPLSIRLVKNPYDSFYAGINSEGDDLLVDYKVAAKNEETEGIGDQFYNSSIITPIYDTEECDLHDRAHCDTIFQHETWLIEDSENFKNRSLHGTWTVAIPTSELESIPSEDEVLGVEIKFFVKGSPRALTDYLSTCGDGLVEGFETCEFDQSVACPDIGGFIGGTAICDPFLCQWNTEACVPNPQLPNSKYSSAASSKQLLLQKVFTGSDAKTLYCGCPFRSGLLGPTGLDLTGCGFVCDSLGGCDLEVGHIVPAAQFGRTFEEWSAGHEECVDSDGTAYVGRRCVEQVNPEFQYMYADMYNLYPVIDAIERVREDKHMGIIPEEERAFGACDFEVGRGIVEPIKKIRGDIARTYLYMNTAYPGRNIIANDAERRMFEDWSENDPVTLAECKRVRRIADLQENENLVVEELCRERDF